MPNPNTDEHTPLDFDGLALMLDGAADSFTGQLLNLMAKADARNTERLAIAYPYQLQAHALWRSLGPHATAAHLRSLLPDDPFAELSTQHIAAARRYFHFTILERS